MTAADGARGSLRGIISAEAHYQRRRVMERTETRHALEYGVIEGITLAGELAERVGLLQRALLRYGWHDRHCDLDGPCTCGWTKVAALAAAGSEGGHGG